MTGHVINCTTALFLSAAVRLPVGHHCCSYYFHGAHLYLHSGAILLDHRIGTFIGRTQRCHSQTLERSSGFDHQSQPAIQLANLLLFVFSYCNMHGFTDEPGMQGFKACSDKFWMRHDVKYECAADMTGIGDR